MKEIFTCSLFEDENFLPKENFDVHQNEALHIEGSNFSKKEVSYKCHWKQKKDFDFEKPFVIIPIKDNSKLLQFTFSNFKLKEFFDFVNVIVVDDRSEEDIEKICDQYSASYLRIDNDKGFNFSMLNNIPAFLIHKLGGKKIIFWNSDLWLDELEYFNTFTKRHEEEGSTISGSKLLYPFESLHNTEDSINITKHFPHMGKGAYKGTVQFGGSRWVPAQNGKGICFFPIHYKRFANKQDVRVNCDTGTEFVTGALQLIDLGWFIESGGFNPSLSKVLQDVDLCLRAVEQQKKVMYFGKDIHFLHDESYNHYSNRNEEKMDNQFRSDNELFVKIWKDKIGHLIF